MENIINRINVLFAGCVLAALTLGACDEEAGEGAQANQVEEAGVITPSALGLGDDWIPLEQGLWTRANERGEQEFAGIGEAGKLHAIASLEDAEADLRRSITGDASEEVEAQLAELDRIITDLRSSQEPISVDEIELRCSSAIVALADAYPIACGVGAKASASYSGCWYSGKVETYAQVACGYESKTAKCGPKSGNPVSCSSATTITGPVSCSSYAYAKVNAPNANVRDHNYTRGSCQSPPTTTVSTIDPPDCLPPAVNCHVP